MKYLWLLFLFSGASAYAVNLSELKTEDVCFSPTVDFKFTNKDEGNRLPTPKTLLTEKGFKELPNIFTECKINIYIHIMLNTSSDGNRQSVNALMLVPKSQTGVLPLNSYTSFRGYLLDNIAVYYAEIANELISSFVSDWDNAHP